MMHMVRGAVRLALAAGVLSSFAAFAATDLYNIDPVVAVKVTYTGEQQSPTPVLTSGGTPLAMGTDFTVEWDDAERIEPGRYLGTAKGIGNYYGTRTVAFDIRPAGWVKTPKWTYDAETKKLTEIVEGDATSWIFSVSDTGVMGVSQTGTGTIWDLREDVLPEECPPLTKTPSGTQKAVTKVLLPDTVTTFGGDFNGGAITEIQLPVNLTALPNYAFQGSKIVSIRMPDTVKSLGASAFNAAKSLKSVVLSDYITSIPGDCFVNCTALEHAQPLTPSHMTSIGNWAFGYCAKLKEPAEIGFGTNELGEARTVTIGERVFYGAGITSLRIGPGYQGTSTPSLIISDCKSIAFIDLGPSITKFTPNMYSTCTANVSPLTGLVFRTTSDVTFNTSDDTLWGCTKLKEVVLNGWMVVPANKNPFVNWTDRQARFIVPGDNASWAAYMADQTKMEPWDSPGIAQSWRDAYYTKYGANARQPEGLSIAVVGGLPREWIVSNGAKPKGFPLAVTPVPASFGSVTVSPEAPPSGLYDAGTVVEVTLSLNDGVEFRGWTGNVPAGSEQSLQLRVTVDSAKTLTANVLASFFDYDGAALTDGVQEYAASGAKESISVNAVRALPPDQTMDLRKPVADGGVITGIGTFDNNKEIKSVLLPDTVSWTGARAFYATTVTNVFPFVPASLVSFGASTFRWLSALTGDLSVGFATDDEGKPKYVSFARESEGDAYTFDGIGSKNVEFGPGVTNVPPKCVGGSSITNLKFSAALQEIKSGGVTSLAPCADVTFGGDKPILAAGSFPGGSGYKRRFFLPSPLSRHPGWKAYIGDRTLVRPWGELDAATRALYWENYPRSAGNRHPTALTLSNAGGIPANQWIFGNAPGLVLMVR